MSAAAEQDVPLPPPPGDAGQGAEHEVAVDHSSMTVAQKEWQIYSQIDMHEEAEMLRIAHMLHDIEESFPELAELAAQDAARDMNAAVDESLGGARTNDLLFSVPVDLDWCLHLVSELRHDRIINKCSMEALLALATAQMQAMGNIQTLSIPPGAQLTVVGDLHGQLSDLLHILDRCGPPSATNFYIFNGDFVDRGQSSLEVMSVLLSFFLACPGRVLLNRGNHEDRQICKSYGFMDEINEKYQDRKMFYKFADLFKHIPVCTVVEDEIFVVHGGIQDGSVRLREIEKGNRRLIKGVPITGERRRQMSPAEYREATVMLSSLWSDPDPTVSRGVRPSARGAGTRFSHEQLLEFLELNELTMCIRSHQVCQDGFEMPFGPADRTEPGTYPSICTVFSASDYSSSMHNKGAVMRFENTESPADGAQASTNQIPMGMMRFEVPRTPLVCTVETYSHGDSGKSTRVLNDRLTLRTIITNKRDRLTASFIKQAEADKVRQEVWADVMKTVTKLDVDWVHLIDEMVPDDAIEGPDGAKMIAFVDALNHICLTSMAKESDTLTDKPLDSLYRNHALLAQLFKYLDADHGGTLSRTEFEKGFSIINGKLQQHGDHPIENIDALMEFMDTNHDGEISYDEFLASFKLQHKTEGKVGLVENAAPTVSPDSPRPSEASMCRRVDHKAQAQGEWLASVKGGPLRGNELITFESAIVALAQAEGDEAEAMAILRTPPRPTGCCTVS